MTARTAAIAQYFSHTTVSASVPASAAVPSRTALWAGRVASGFAVLFLTFDACFKVFAAAQAAEHSTQLGWSTESIHTLGFIQLACLVTYLVPRTSVLGALLWTGYLGGAVATHLRIADPLFSHTLFPIYVATFLWLGLWLRDPRVRALLPLTR